VKKILKVGLVLDHKGRSVGVTMGERLKQLG
jgi:hypothetical protein